MKKLIKYCCAIAVMLAITSFCVSAAPACNLNVNYVEKEDNEVEVLIKHDSSADIGGLDFQIIFNTDEWRLDKDTVVAYGKGSNVTTEDGYLRYLWDTAGSNDLGEDVMYAVFVKMKKESTIEGLNLQVNEFYDGSTELNDFDYTVNYVKTEGKLKVRSNAWIFVVITVVIVLAGAAAGYVLYFKRKKYTDKH